MGAFLAQATNWWLPLMALGWLGWALWQLGGAWLTRAGLVYLALLETLARLIAAI